MAILMFAAPSALMTFSLYVILPMIATRVSYPIFWWFLLLYLLPLSLMLPASYIAYRLEGNPQNWQAFKERFNLKPLKGRDWAWVIGLVSWAFRCEEMGWFCLSTRWL